MDFNCIYNIFFEINSPEIKEKSVGVSEDVFHTHIMNSP